MTEANDLVDHDVHDPAGFEFYSRPEVVGWVEGPDQVFHEAGTIGGWIAIDVHDAVRAIR